MAHRRLGSWLVYSYSYSQFGGFQPKDPDSSYRENWLTWRQAGYHQTMVSFGLMQKLQRKKLISNWTKLCTIFYVTVDTGIGIETATFNNTGNIVMTLKKLPRFVSMARNRQTTSILIISGNSLFHTINNIALEFPPVIKLFFQIGWLQLSFLFNFLLDFLFGFLFNRAIFFLDECSVIFYFNFVVIYFN